MILRTIIVPAALVANARELGGALSPAGAGMYTTGLSATGALPATHYVSSGLISEPFAAILSDPIILYTTAQKGATSQGLTLTSTQAKVTDLVAQSMVGDETVEPLQFIRDNGLKIITTNN